MTREEAIEQLKLWLNYLYPDTDIYHAVAMAIIALEEQQWTHITVRPLTDEELKEHQDWIGMYEDTPPIDEEVLVSDGKYIWTDTLMDDGEGVYFDNSNCDIEKLWWMQLPNLPKGEES